jgi:hypothetical protein
MFVKYARYCNWLISEAFEPVLSFLKVRVHVSVFNVVVVFASMNMEFPNQFAA